MNLLWPFTNTVKVSCPDGRVVYVYKNVESAFRSYVREPSIRFGAKLDLLGEVSGAISGEVASRVDRLVNLHDSQVAHIFIEFRIAYEVFKSDPCNQNEFLGREVERILQAYRRLRHFNAGIHGLIGLVRANPEDTDRIAKTFEELARHHGDIMAPEATQDEIRQTRKEAEEWRGPD